MPDLLNEEALFELMGIYGDQGDDDEDGEYDELGVRVRARRGGARARKSMIRALRRNLVSAMPGVPKQGPRVWPVGFPVAIFTAGSPTTVLRTTRPQKPIKGNRLVVEEARFGPTAVGLLTIDRWLVGVDPQIASVDPIPATAYARDAVGTGVIIDQAQPGVDLSLQFTLGIPALAGADSVSASAMLNSLSAG